MSTWSVVTDDGHPEQMAELIDRMQLGEYIEHARAEAQQKLDAAKVAAKALLAAEAVGRPNSIFRVGISGRSNPDHSPDEPLVYEMLSIVVYEIAQVTEATSFGPMPAPEAEPEIKSEPMGVEE